LKSDFAATAWKRCRQNPIVAEALKTHAHRSRDFTYALAAEWWEGKGKSEAGNRAFRLDLYQAQILTRHARQLKRLATALRRTSGKLVASYFATYTAWGRIGIFARRRDGKQGFVVLTAAMKLRKKFRRDAARR
jgi:hypothetical protein